MYARALVLVSLVNIIYLVLCYDGVITGYEIGRIINVDGYVAEVHGVLTPDGYMLELHRIPYKRNESSGDPNRPVVFLMHGLLAASFHFIYLGPEYSISYNLADAGFDVWMGNARGTRNSRKHYVLNPDDGKDRKKFFDFTWEEIALKDVSSFIDFITGHTKQRKIHYIGHSQGGTVFLVLNSMKPEYNAKIASAHLLAGVGYMEYFPNKLLTGLAMFTNTIYTLATRLGIVELFPPPANRTYGPPTEEEVTETDERRYLDAMENFDFNCYSDEICRPADFCTGNINQKEMCELFGVEEIVHAKILDNVGSDIDTGGASLKQVAHYGQNIQDQAFRRWNYGAMENFQKYGSSSPPEYNLSNIDVDTTMHYTISDTLLDERDVRNMCKDMPSCKVRKVARDSFLHVDFVAAGDVKELVTEHMIHEIWRMHFVEAEWQRKDRAAAGEPNLTNPPNTEGPDPEEGSSATEGKSNPSRAGTTLSLNLALYLLNLLCAVFITMYNL